MTTFSAIGAQIDLREEVDFTSDLLAYHQHNAEREYLKKHQKKVDLNRKAELEALAKNQIPSFWVSNKAASNGAMEIDGIGSHPFDKVSYLPFERKESKSFNLNVPEGASYAIITRSLNGHYTPPSNPIKVNSLHINLDLQNGESATVAYSSHTGSQLGHVFVK